MTNLPKRKLSEQIQIYKYEPSMRDIFVEGSTDKNFYEYFLGQMGVVNFRVFPVELLDFVGEIELDDLSNKNKLFQLSLKLQNVFGTSLSSITCIVDKDHNDFYHEIDENFYLFLTDFTSLEMYFFNEVDIGKFLKIGLHDFPVTAKQLIQIIGNTLQNIFIIKCAKYNEYKGASPVKLDSVIKINKQCIITFDPNDYLSKFLLRNGLNRSKEYFETRIEELKTKLTKDYRNQVCGKDVIELIYKIIKIVKGNQPGFTEESLARALILLPHESKLKEYNLFKKLLARYIETAI